LILDMGFRRIISNPIYSENTHNCDKHKYERFLHPGRTCVASTFSPITFPPCPVLLLKRKHDQGEEDFEIIGNGFVLGVDPDRIILKRIRLTGYPFKIRRKVSVIRQMFYTPDDVRWFKPVELNTKHGRRGAIVESLGTHGLMKCRFDGMLKSDDTIFINLYKRIFPKFFSLSMTDLNQDKQTSSN